MSGASFNLPKSQKQNTDLEKKSRKNRTVRLSPVRPEVHWNKDDLNDSQTLKKNMTIH